MSYLKYYYKVQGAFRGMLWSELNVSGLTNSYLTKQR